MMAINRYRLRHAAESGVRGAMRAQALLDQTDKLLGVILLGNNLVNSARVRCLPYWPFACSATAKWCCSWRRCCSPS